MRTFKGLTKQKAKEAGFSSNFSFASDSAFCPSGVETIGVRREGENEPYEHEITTYDSDTDTVKVVVMTRAEYLLHLKKQNVL